MRMSCFIRRCIEPQNLFYGELKMRFADNGQFCLILEVMLFVQFSTEPCRSCFAQFHSIDWNEHFRFNLKRYDFDRLNGAWTLSTFYYKLYEVLNDHVPRKGKHLEWFVVSHGSS